ncbi:hypothetical protein GCM10017778_26180 [Streptomyces vinaceus]|nr:hypothetical protein GCM10017778_26180 [Streptomyces vinaceus]
MTPRPGSGGVTTTYVIEGGRIGTLDDFWALVGEAVNGPGGYFGRNLDSFADCLRGGFGTPDEGGFVIEWRDHELSRRALGHPETARRLEGVLERCHPKTASGWPRSSRGPATAGARPCSTSSRRSSTPRPRAPSASAEPSHAPAEPSHAPAEPPRRPTHSPVGVDDWQDGVYLPTIDLPDGFSWLSTSTPCARRARRTVTR